jgi:tetratricopeptide (TPR) repeat protein
VGGVRLFLPTEERCKRESWRLQHREQRDRYRQPCHLWASAISGREAMTALSLCLGAALAVSVAVASPQAALALGDKVEAGSCAIANSGSAGGNSVTCNFNMPPEKLKELIEAAAKGGEAPLLDRLVLVSKTLGVTEGAAKTLLKIVGEDPNIPDDKLAEALTRAAEDFKKVQAQLAALKPDNPTAEALVEQTKPEIEAGHFGRAHELLHQATQAQIAAAQKAEKLEQQAHAARDAQMLGAASSTAAEGDVAMTERRYTSAAELFGQAADFVPSGHTREHSGYLLHQADALYRQGDERGDNAALRSAIDVYETTLAEYPRERVPLDWAASQHSLGNAFRALGERVLFDWATTQVRLGDALLTLGERESGTERLNEAVAAYRAALEEYTPERVPLNWARMQVRLGNALVELGWRESGTARLEEAVAAYRAALAEAPRERVPLDWSVTQANLGGALQALGERESGTARLEEAVAVFRAALEERTRERVPLQWAVTQNNLGLALGGLGWRESGTARLEEAVAAFRAALEEETRELVPLRWAEITGNQGIALMLIADRNNDAAVAEAAVRQIEMAFEALRSGGGEEHSSALFGAQLTNARAIRDRLASLAKP